MATLFQQIERKDTDSRGYSESMWKYLNRTAHPGFDYVRQLLETWFEAYTGDEKKRNEFLKQFCSRKDDEHLSSFFELYLYTIFRNLGCSAEVEPEYNGRKPDFLLKSPAGEECVLEATGTYPERLFGTGRKEVDRIYDYLNTHVVSSDYSLSVKVQTPFDSSLSLKRLAVDTQSWLNSLHYDVICNLVEDHRQTGDWLDILPTYEWPRAGGYVQMQAIPKKPASRQKPSRIVKVMPEEVQFIQSDDELRNTVKSKSKRYGDLGCPYIVAVNLTDPSVDEIDIANALFGDEKHLVYADGTVDVTRDQNGIWSGPRGIRSTTLTGVLLFNRVFSTHIHRVEPELWLNPDAKYKLASELPFATVSVDTSGNFVRTPAKMSVADILDIDFDRMPF